MSVYTDIWENNSTDLSWGALSTRYLNDLLKPDATVDLDEGVFAEHHVRADDPLLILLNKLRPPGAPAGGPPGPPPAPPKGGVPQNTRGSGPPPPPPGANAATTGTNRPPPPGPPGPPGPPKGVQSTSSGVANIRSSKGGRHRPKPEEVSLCVHRVVNAIQQLDAPCTGKSPQYGGIFLFIHLSMNKTTH